ncbi:MAG: hypothetical protein AAFV53_03695 [Myxococcota bacterium]
MRSPPLIAHLVVLFVIAHVGVTTFQAVPLPRKILTDKAARRSGTQDTWIAWGQVLASVGLVDAPDAFADQMQAWNNTITEQRMKALRPLRFYYVHTGTGQSWRMFSTVRPRGARLELYVRQELEWMPVFLEHRVPQWRARLLNQERVRTIRTGFSKRNSQQKNHYNRFVNWLAREAATDFPDATHFRAQYRQLIIKKPAQIRIDGGLETGEVFWQKVVPLDRYR